MPGDDGRLSGATPAARRLPYLPHSIIDMNEWMKHDGLAQQLFREQGLSCDLSPYIVTRDEALMMQPIYYDLVDHHVVVWDPEGIIGRIISSASALLKEVGAYRVRQNNTWEWRTNRFLGGVRL